MAFVVVRLIHYGGSEAGVLYLKSKLWDKTLGYLKYLVWGFVGITKLGADFELSGGFLELLMAPLDG